MCGYAGKRNQAEGTASTEMATPQLTPRNSKAGVDGVGGAQKGENRDGGQDGWIDKEVVVHIHNRTLLSY